MTMVLIIYVNPGFWKILRIFLFMYSLSNSLHFSLSGSLIKHVKLFILPAVNLFVLVFYCFDILVISIRSVCIFKFSKALCLKIIFHFKFSWVHRKCMYLWDTVMQHVRADVFCESGAHMENLY